MVDNPHTDSLELRNIHGDLLELDRYHDGTVVLSLNHDFEQSMALDPSLVRQIAGWLRGEPKDDSA